MHVVDHVIEAGAREQLKQYFLEYSAKNPPNPYNTTKHYFVKQWTDQDWPQALAKAVLDRVLDQSYEVEFVFFGGGSGDGFQLHVDTQEQDDQSRNYKIVIIPIDFQGSAKTVFFDNHWLGPKAALRLPKANHDRLTDPGRGVGIARTITVKDLTNYDPNKSFDQHTQQQHIGHVSLENLHGLTLDEIVEWRLGSAMVFDRTQLHCAGTGHAHKIWMTCFTLLAQ
jgi:hypothetical protein